MKVINLFGGPCFGKSTAAAGLFYLMKRHQYNAELVQEVAKHLVWAERYKSLDDQLYVFAKQNDRLHTLKGKVDYAISDSPLILSGLYMPAHYPASFAAMVLDIFNLYDNLNIVLRRIHPFQPEGRIHTEEQADAIGRRIVRYLDEHNIPYVTLDANAEAPEKILALVRDTATNLSGCS